MVLVLRKRGLRTTLKHNPFCCPNKVLNHSPDAHVYAAPRAQAALVRALKEEHGLTNEDPDVAEAVGALLRRKDRLQVCFCLCSCKDIAPFHSQLPPAAVQASRVLFRRHAGFSC